MKRPSTSVHEPVARGPNRAARESACGFTLVELMVALTLLAILLSSIYATFYSGVQAIRSRRDLDDVYLVSRVVMQRITEDLSMAFYRPGSDRKDTPTQTFIGLDRADNEYARDRLDFTSASHVLARDGQPETDLVEVSYYIDDTYRDKPLLVRREDPLPDRDLRHGGTLRVLAEQVVALDFRYREPMPPTNQPQTPDEETEDDEEEEVGWHDTWNASTWKPRPSLPDLVEVTVTIRDEDGVEHTFRSRVRLYPYQTWQSR